MTKRVLCINTESAERPGVVTLIAIITISIQGQLAAGGVYMQSRYPHSYCDPTDPDYTCVTKYESCVLSDDTIERW